LSLASALSTALVLPAAAQQAAGAASSPQQFQTLVNKYCIGCHSDKLKTGGVVLESRDYAKITEDAQVWEKVVRKVRAGEMPPVGLPRPDKSTLDGFASWIETTIDTAAAAHPNPGRTMVHRLNRTEYQNSIKDVLGIDLDTSALLPPDDSADGFDNIAQALTISPALLEKYMSASARITRFAVGDPATGVISATYRPRPDLSQDTHIEGTPVGTMGGLAVTHYFPLDGEYTFSPKLSQSILGMIHGLEDEHAIEVTIDGQRVQLVHFGGNDGIVKTVPKSMEYANMIHDRMAFRTKVKAGPHKIAVAFLRQSAAQTAEIWQQYQRTAIDANETKGFPHLDKITIEGPYNPTGPGDTPSRRKIFTCRPTSGKDELPCAKSILTQIARRAYRRPLTDSDTEKLLVFYQRGRNNQGTFDQGIEMGIRRIISGPEFVFRTETDPANVAPETPYRISDIELASRLSYFLWSTVPDDQLYDLAVQGRLKDPVVLEQQVRRMMSDPKAQAIVENFAAQWLQLRNLRGIVPDPDVFPDFDDNLRQSFARETELFFGSIMREDRPVSDLLTANYTYLNQRLATHYGVPGIYGDQFRRVPVTDDARRGLLGQGSILTLTSVATRTSPVQRGKWILINVLGTPPPPPPPNVPALKEDATAKAQTMRDRMTAHRANPFCATCHKVMDPIGFSMENYDAVGRWRTTDGEAPIDANDTIFDGTKIDGTVGLRNFLLSRKDVFIQTFTEKMMTYALGRAVDYRDMPSVRRILSGSAAKDYRFSSILMGIVASPQFQMRVKAPAAIESNTVLPVTASLK
jgi:mono/diheme cytochrome c family protein